jgi:hypothetical protein
LFVCATTPPSSAFEKDSEVSEFNSDAATGANIDVIITQAKRITIILPLVMGDEGM